MVTWARPVQVNKMEEAFGTGSELWGLKGECMDWKVKGVGSNFVNRRGVISWLFRAPPSKSRYFIADISQIGGCVILVFIVCLSQSFLMSCSLLRYIAFGQWGGMSRTTRWHLEQRSGQDRELLFPAFWVSRYIFWLSKIGLNYVEQLTVGQLEKIDICVGFVFIIRTQLINCYFK